MKKKKTEYKEIKDLTIFPSQKGWILFIVLLIIFLFKKSLAKLEKEDQVLC